MKCGRFDGCGAYRVVRAVISARLVDWPQLHELEAASSRPVDELGERSDITDAKIILGPQR